VTSVLGIFIQWPFLAAVPAAGFALAFARRRSGVVLAATLAWVAHLPYEYGMKLRILCSGECNIRVDLLLIYPLLLAVSMMAARRIYKFSRG